MRSIRPVKIVDNLAPPILSVVAEMWETHHPQHIAEEINTRFGRIGVDCVTPTAVWNMAGILHRLDRERPEG